MENTFDVDNQKQNQTTSILIAAQYKLAGSADYGADIYAVHGNLYSAATLKTYLADVFNALSYKNGTDAGVGVLTAANFEINPSNYIFKDIVTFKGGDLLDSNGITVIASDATPVFNKAKMDELIASALGARALSFYESGRCFYSIPIRHFNDSQVALYNANGTDFLDINGVKGINCEHQLGRYGVVRNNWYSVNVNSIAQIGRPAPVDPKDPINPDPSFPDPKDPIPGKPTPDDVESLYLKAEINILPWALRSQDADL